MWLQSISDNGLGWNVWWVRLRIDRETALQKTVRMIK